MALVASNITSVAPEPRYASASDHVEAGRRWAKQHRFSDIPPLVALEVGYTLALVGDSPELLAETRARLGLSDRKEQVGDPTPPPETKRKRGELMEAKLDLRVSAEERRSLQQWANRNGKKLGAYARELLSQGLAFERAQALERQEAGHYRR